MAYQDPNFNKDEYWKRRNTRVDVENPKTGEKSNVHQPMRGQNIASPVRVLPNDENGAPISFDNSGHMVVKNRAFRRKATKLPTPPKRDKSKRIRKNRIRRGLKVK